MPKKMTTNTKAVEAKVRKQEKKRCENEAKQKAVEEKYWKDDEKHANKKIQRKENKETKIIEKLEKKKELQNLLDKEMNQILYKTQPVQKVTHFQLEELRKKQNEAAGIKKKTIEDPIAENVNQLIFHDDGARNIDDALKMLNEEDKPDRHVEKRVKAAYLKFEEQRMPELKKENPRLRFGQLKQILSKEFENSPANPKNQDYVDYNLKI